MENPKNKQEELDVAELPGDNSEELGKKAKENVEKLAENAKKDEEKNRQDQINLVEGKLGIKNSAEKEQDMEKMRSVYVKILKLYKEEAIKQAEEIKNKKGFWNKIRNYFDEGSSDEAIKKMDVMIMNTMKKNPGYQTLSIIYPETDRTLGLFNFSKVDAYGIIKQELGEEKAKEVKADADKRYPSSVVGNAPSGTSI